MQLVPTFQNVNHQNVLKLKQLCLLPTNVFHNIRDLDSAKFQ